MCVIETVPDSAQLAEMLSSGELLRLMADRGIKRAKIAKTLGVAPARVTEMYKGERQIKLDEAKILVDALGLNNAPTASPLSEPAARFLVLHGAQELGVEIDPDDQRVQELARDFQAFSQFLADPRARQTEDAVAAFFQGLRLAQDRAG